MKNVSFIFVLLISFVSFSQQTDFTVAAGAQRTLTSDERTLSLKNLNLGDGCTIIIPASMDGWTVTATDVTIGNDVKIIGMGLNGAAGSSGSNGANGATCMNGGNGGTGSMGAPGTRGKNVSLTLRIKNIGSLLINVTGGNGGSGGNGGFPGKGGSASCDCNAGAGGNGGNGGRGGAGGSGGNVNVSYSAVGSVAVTNSNFVIQNPGGRSGIGGAATNGALGGAGGGCTDPKALVRSAGAAGKSGTPGSFSNQGPNGITTLQNNSK